MNKILFFIIIIVLISCSTKSDMTLNKDGSGLVQFALNFDNIVIEYLADISDSFSTDKSFFSYSILEKYFNENKSVKLEKLYTDKTSFFATLSFKDLNDIYIKKFNDFNYITFSKEKSLNVVNMFLDKNKINKIVEAIPFLDDNILNYLKPNEGLNQKEYEEELFWLFQDYLEEETKLKNIIKLSKISITIKVDGKIKEVFNGKKISDNKVTFIIPVTKILTQNKTVTYKLTYL